MKTGRELPKYRGEKLNSLTFQCLEGQLVYKAIELKVFNFTEKEIQAGELAKKLNLNPRNLELFLKALVSMDYLTYESGFFANTDETNYFLNEKSSMYIGENILYWRDMTSLENLEDLLISGGDIDQANKDNGSDFFDFRSMGLGARNSMYLGRVQGFLSNIDKLFDEKDEINILDLGCGSGVLSIEIVKNFANAKATLVDQEQVINMTREVVIENQVADKITLVSGDFNSIKLEDKYDLIIASGILDFVKDIDQVCQNMYNALKDDGYLYIDTHKLDDNFTGPKNFILGWLSANLNGLDILKPESVILGSLTKKNFELVDMENNSNIIFEKANKND